MRQNSKTLIKKNIKLMTFLGLPTSQCHQEYFPRSTLLSRFPLYSPYYAFNSKGSRMAHWSRCASPFCREVRLLEFSWRVQSLSIQNINIFIKFLTFKRVFLWQWIAQRFASANNPTRWASATSWSASMADDWNLIPGYMPCVISRTSL